MLKSSKHKYGHNCTIETLLRKLFQAATTLTDFAREAMYRLKPMPSPHLPGACINLYTLAESAKRVSTFSCSVQCKLVRATSRFWTQLLFIS